MKTHYDKCHSIATFIAAALRHPLLTIDDNWVWSSSIVVRQYKNKFDQVCVYCDLADYNLISEAWSDDGKEGAPTPEHLRRCMLHDAKIYRDAYMSMINLVPDLESMIVVRADYSHLLYEDMMGVDAWIAKLVDDASKSQPMQAYLSRIFLSWCVTDAVQLREQLRLVYERK